MKKLKEISIKEFVQTIKNTAIPTVTSLGNGLYRLPDGIITNLNGLKKFDKQVRKHEN